MLLKRLLIVAPFLATVLTGCIKEDRSDCPPEYNMEFLFEYTAEPNIAFTNSINSVDLLLFDADSYFLEHRRSDKTALDAFQGMRFDLTPGTYYAVAWANVDDHSSFSDFRSTTKMFSECFLEIAEEVYDGGDPIFYAPKKGVSSGADIALYMVQVLSDRNTVKILDFTKAHRTINVWVHGYEQSGLGENTQPTICAKKLCCMYDFYFGPLAVLRDYKKPAHDEERLGEHYSLSTFYSALGEISDEAEIDVNRTSDDQLVHSLNLRQFVLDNSITNTDQIDVLISFLADLSVTVTVPRWEAKPVQPGAK